MVALNSDLILLQIVEVGLLPVSDFHVLPPLALPRTPYLHPTSPNHLHLFLIMASISLKTLIKM